MLLLIALAHSRMLHAGGNDLTAPSGGGWLDVTVQWLLTSLVDGRSAPLFGILFGYGLVQLTRRHSGPDGDSARARRLIRRGGAWLVVFGVVHVVLRYRGTSSAPTACSPCCSPGPRPGPDADCGQWARPPWRSAPPPTACSR